MANQLQPGWFHVFLWCLFLALAAGCIAAQSVSFAAYNDIDQGGMGFESDLLGWFFAD